MNNITQHSYVNDKQRTAPRAEIGEQPENVSALATELSAAIEGEVRFDDGSRATYATDASNYRQAPIGVVLPKSVDDVVKTVALCRKHGAPITARGGGTSLAGQCCNIAVVIDFSKYMHHVLELDPDRRRAKVQPGANLDTLRRQAEQYHLTFGPDPATHDHNTLGGMIGNNSCGVHSVMAQFYGPGPLTVDSVESLEILTYDGLRLTVGATSEEELSKIINQGGRRGEIYAGLKTLRDRYADQIRTKYPNIPRRVSGYNLDRLLPEHNFNVAGALVGSEGTCVIVLSATLKLMPNPAVRSLLVLGYPDAYHAGDHIMEILEHKPVGLEGIDQALIGYMKKKHMHPEDVEMLPDGGGWLLVEFGGDSKEDADNKAQKLMDELKKKDDAPSMKLFDDKEQEHHIWLVRESGLGATANVPGMSPTHPGWEDAAVPPEKVGPYLRDFRKLLNEFDYQCALYGHFGQGCIHCRIDFDLLTTEGVKKYLAFIDKAADLVISYGGSLSGEHGDGQARSMLLPKMYGERLVDAFREFKKNWDPGWKMNPGKVIDGYRPDENLRMGPRYNPPSVKTRFGYPDDDGSFAKATARCVGVGMCRRVDSGVMCPSYMATREEAYSTRGRARLLFEMLQGDIVADGWRDQRIHDALDWCLACKGCKHDCPVNVDMATYKAEFMSHYYRYRLRSRHEYAMGLIYWWSRAASKLPLLTNFFTQHEPFAFIIKKIGGIASERRLPLFTKQTFRDWFQKRQSNQSNKPRVILWPDTFSNHFLPEPAKAAVEVLEAAGYQVELPPRPLCCGRPLYDIGMLDLAKKLWRQTLTALQSEITAGTPIVGLEPSCVAAFRDELINLFPNDYNARRLSQQTMLLSSFLRKIDYRPPKLRRRALVHAHCNHRAIMGMKAEEALLNRLGLDYELMDSGCCGMAGAFGFSEKKYDVSIKIGERVLLPAVRNAAQDTLVITNGFSCREQISQTTGRRALHLAEILALALREGKQELFDGDPEFNVCSHPRHPAFSLKCSEEIFSEKDD